MTAPVRKGAVPMRTFPRKGGETVLPAHVVTIALRSHTRASQIATPTPPPMPEAESCDCPRYRMRASLPDDMPEALRALALRDAMLDRELWVIEEAYGDAQARMEVT